MWTADLDDGRRVVVKQTPYPAEVEAEGLRALAAGGAPVPGVLYAHERLLVLEHVGGPPDWEALGAALAGLHATTGDAFGWRRDNLIGSLPQPNTPTPSWPAFYAEQRIRPQLDAPGLPPDLRSRLDRALAGPLQELLDTDPAPSLTHGDLWSGNIVDGRWLVDPAVCHADREHELAFAALFGGIPDALFAAYQRAWPLPHGWQGRRPALQLYHLLVHVRLFGSGYAAGVAARLDALGW